MACSARVSGRPPTYDEGLRKDDRSGGYKRSGGKGENIDRGCSRRTEYEESPKRDNGRRDDDSSTPVGY